MHTATKTAIDAAKNTSKVLAQKKVEDAGDLLGNKIADKIISVAKRKSNGEEDETNKKQEMYTPPGKG